MVAPLEQVTQPNAGIRPYRGGLFDAATIEEGDGRWAMGVFYASDRCANGGWVQGWCPSKKPGIDPTNHKKGFDSNSSPWIEQPNAFTVYELYGCKLPGMTVAERRQIAAQRLLAAEQLEAERAFWNLNLTLGDKVFKPGGDTAVNLKHGLGSLEAYATQVYSNAGVIHLPRWVMPYMDSADLIRGDPGQLQTRLGTRLAFGGGYYGTAPDGTAPADPADFWAYVTGEVVIRRGTVHVADAVAYETNDHQVLAERTYLITTDCLLGAVAVDLDA